MSKKKLGIVGLLVGGLLAFCTEAHGQRLDEYGRSDWYSDGNVAIAQGALSAIEVSCSSARGYYKVRLWRSNIGMTGTPVSLEVNIDPRPNEYLPRIIAKGDAWSVRVPPAGIPAYLPAKKYRLAQGKAVHAVIPFAMRDSIEGSEIRFRPLDHRGLPVGMGRFNLTNAEEALGKLPCGGPR